MITDEALRTKLDGYPPELLDRYAAFHARRDPRDLNAFVIGLIRFLQDAGDPMPEAALSDDLSLRGDMEIDSITIAEVVFLLEEILEIEIENSELAKITTIGELKAYILQKL